MSTDLRCDMKRSKRFGGGEQIVTSVARLLEAEHGRGSSAKNLRHVMRFAESFPSEDIVYALSRQLSWTHLRPLAGRPSRQSLASLSSRRASGRHVAGLDHELR